MSKYTITLNDGKQLDDLTMNGSMFVSQTEVTAEDFSAEALESVTIVETDDAGDTTETTMENAICDGIIHWPEGWLFNLRQLTTQEQQVKDMEGQIDMLTECILEMSEIIYGE